jgi:hypothetical protein
MIEGVFSAIKFSKESPPHIQLSTIKSWKSYISNPALTRIGQDLLRNVKGLSETALRLALVRLNLAKPILVGRV